MITTNWRYINDIATIWGVRQYFTYSLIDWLQLGVRAEIWRDSEAFYAAQYGGNNDVIHFVRGDNLSPSFPRDPSNLGGGHTTYFEVTWGVTIKRPAPKPLTALLIRPEVSYDRALTKQLKPFAQKTSRDQWTLGLDLVMEAAQENP